MATFEISIVPMLRPCLVNKEECLFHTWEQYMEPIGPSMLRGGCPGGQLAYTLGIVEKADGTIMKVLPSDIKFVDSLNRETWLGGAYRDADKNC